ncbi:MAG: hypothetical protein ACXAEB_10325 [Candidatus Thorarchaeota archaeon]|jgi:hypothetical protein
MISFLKETTSTYNIVKVTDVRNYDFFGVVEPIRIEPNDKQLPSESSDKSQMEKDSTIEYDNG